MWNFSVESLLPLNNILSYFSKLGFLDPCIINILGQIIFCC